MLFDAYGVLKAHAGLYPGVPARLRELRVPWWIVSNDASRTAEHLAAGYPAPVTPEHFVSSGMVLGEALRAQPREGLIAYLGPETCAGTFAGLEARPFMELEDLDRVAVVALMDDGCFAWRHELNRIVNLIRARPEVELLCANPDLTWPDAGTRVGLGSGALAALLEAALGREVPRFGKPDRPIYELALAKARAELPDLQPAEVLMVGDTLATDVAGARAMGFDALLVLGGNETPATWEAKADQLGLRPDHVLPSIVD